MHTSYTRLLFSAPASLPTEPSGPGTPILRLPEARRLFSRITSASLHTRIRRSSIAAERDDAGSACHSSTAEAIGPEPRGGVAPPIDVRSFISVVRLTRHPSPGRP